MPISGLKLHPSIQHYLSGLKLKQISPIFKLDEYYIFLRLDRSLTVQLTPQIEQQLRNELFEEWLQQQIFERLNTVSTARISNDRVAIDRSVKQLSQPGNLSDEELAISVDLDLNFEPTDLLCPTSSLFFPQISPNGKILSPNCPTRQHINSSLFFHQQSDPNSDRRSPNRRIRKDNRRCFVDRIAAFCGFSG